MERRATAEFVRQHGGNVLPRIDKCDRIATLACGVVATAEKYPGNWWGLNQYGELVLGEATQRSLHGGADIDS